MNTSRRTYHIELRATPATYMASVSWSYPPLTLEFGIAERDQLGFRIGPGHRRHIGRGGRAELDVIGCISW